MVCLIRLFSIINVFYLQDIFNQQISSPVIESTQAALPDRCSVIEFDAIVPNEKGTTLFFKGSHLWKGYHGDAQLSTNAFKELDDIHGIGHVDAAFRMHNLENTGDHDHIYFFLDDKVFSYYNETLEEGYPKCPKTECKTDAVLFFKGHDVHVYDIPTKAVKTKTWSHLPACTSALRWLEHYYCFHGHNFTRFHPVTGEVSGNYPKDARNYFMKCDNFGHGHGYMVPKCNETKLDAITSDDTGKTYFFAGPIYMRLDTARDGLHAFPITRSWREVAGGVDAVFSYTDKMYMIKGDQVYIYKGDAHYTLIDGYPKSILEELNIEGNVDAAFVCPSEDTVHVIQGRRIRAIDLSATPRVVLRDLPLPFSNIDAAHCSSDGIRVYKGGQYYEYQSPMLLATSKIAPRPHAISPEQFRCKP
uniref:Hemopexin n=1 Tax=Neogobius melanostomus TaxID=47308 RepID=A0A8C6SXZ8_9GOBI